MVFLALRKLKQKLAYWNWINLNIQIYQLKLSRKTHTFSNFICESIKNSMQSSIFLSCLKHADVTPLHKKCNKSFKKSYSQINILPILSKVFERSMFNQMSSFFDDIFWKYQYGWRKGFSSQQCLLGLLEKRKRSIDRAKVFDALLTDFSKTFDCLNLDLLVTKLNAYGFR